MKIYGKIQVFLDNDENFSELKEPEKLCKKREMRKNDWTTIVDVDPAVET